MIKIIKRLLSVGLVFNLGINQVQGEESSAPYVLTQSINNIPIEKHRCIELLRTYLQSGEEETDVAQQLSEEIDNLNQTIANITTEFNALNDTIAQLDQTQQQANEQYALAIETTYEAYRQNDADFELQSDEEKLALLAEDSQVKEWQLALENIEHQLNEQISQRDKLEKQHQQISYELDVRTNQLEQHAKERSELNQCLLYPYSVQRENTSQLLINTQVRELDELLVNLDVYLQRLVPIAYRKVSFMDIAKLFSVTRTAAEVEEELYGKQEIKLDDRGKEYYSYARELNIYDIEILANLALKDYFASGDLNQLHMQYEEVLAIKEGQYAYFYAINQEAFGQIKQLLVDYLNGHQLWDPHTIQQLQSFHERYQMKLVLFDESVQQWYIAPAEESGFYQRFSTYHLEGEISSHSESLSGESLEKTDDTPNESQPKSSSSLSSLKNKLKRKKTEQSNLTKSLSKPERKKNTNERKESESSSVSKSGLQSQSKKNQAKKEQSVLSDNPPATLPKAESNSDRSKKSKQEEMRLPSTGEQQLILWIAIAMLIIGVGILLWDVYLRYKKRKALEKIKLD